METLSKLPISNRVEDEKICENEEDSSSEDELDDDYDMEEGDESDEVPGEFDDRLGIRPGHYTNNCLISSNRKRLYCAEKRSTERVKRQRQRLRAIKKGLWDK
eukprot:gene3560-2345_t